MPRVFDSVKNILYSKRAIDELKIQKERAISVSRQNKLENRSNAHFKNILNNVLFQGTNTAVKLTAKYSILKEIGENE